MATEAQKLIGLSLAKIAQSRMNRGGISLHKNLLVATVLQKARYIFMEEAYGVAFVQSMMNQQTEETEARSRPDDTQKGTEDCKQDAAVDAQRRVCKRRRDAPEVTIEPALSPKRCCEYEGHADQQSSSPTPDPAERLAGEPMEVERITSLVSVFTFAPGAPAGDAEAAGPPRLNRSSSTPDMCSAQAKELDSLQRRPAPLAMTV